MPIINGKHYPDAEAAKIFLAQRDELVAAITTAIADIEHSRDMRTTRTVWGDSPASALSGLRAALAKVRGQNT